jgi:hypothetical protein
MKQKINLRTTINFETTRLEYLKNRCNEKGLDVQDVIKIAVKHYIDSFGKKEPVWNTITYQEDAPHFTKKHFSMKPYEYDTYMDIKKLHRLSFSYIVAIALDHFLELILEGKCPHSYPLNSYTKFLIDKEDCTFLVFSWGFPFKTDSLELIPQKE